MPHQHQAKNESWLTNHQLDSQNSKLGVFRWVRWFLRSAETHECANNHKKKFCWYLAYIENIQHVWMSFVPVNYYSLWKCLSWYTCTEWCTSTWIMVNIFISHFCCSFIGLRVSLWNRISKWNCTFLGKTSIFCKYDLQFLTCSLDDAIWYCRILPTQSTLVHLMVCCLIAPVHYPSQCWLNLNCEFIAEVSDCVWILYEGLTFSYECKYMYELTHWGRDQMASISQTTHSNAFSWMKMCEFRLRLHWCLSTGLELTIFQHWFW